MDDPLLAMIVKKSFKRGFFTLSSGATSEFLFDLKPTMLDPLGSTMLADRILDRLSDLIEVDAIGGYAIGAVPLVAVTVSKSLLTTRPLSGCYVRHRTKDHGTQQQIEGISVAGKQIVLLEDVTTTGNSLLQAATAIRMAGGRVTTAITVIDRLAGGMTMLAAHDISLLPIYILEDFT